MSCVMPHNDETFQYNESLRRDGTMPEAWQSLLNHTDSLTQQQLNARQHDIDRQLRANGLGYHPENTLNNGQRAWAPDILPVLFDSTNWQSLSNGLNQRSRLHETLYRDIYGPQALLREGILPAAMVYSHSGYLRDLVNPDADTSTTQNLPLTLQGTDLMRQANGEWLVVGDSNQYPAGVGYALENRLVISRVLPDTFKDYRVQRIASYFRQVQHAMTAEFRNTARCVLLSYPASHPHYFEFAWLAKYLGYTLVETADLTVRDNLVFIKTVAGLQPVDVILRFIDDADLDPMIIGNPGPGGVPGLVEAARRGGVRIINPPGAAILDNPAFNTLLPTLCQRLLNESLLLPSQPTYWLGDDAQREHALAHEHELQFRHIDPGSALIDLQALTPQDRDAMLGEMTLAPSRYVAQLPIRPSVAPTLLQQQSTLCQIAIRTFQVKRQSTDEPTDTASFDTMPGGLCFVNSTPSTSPITIDQFSNSKDIWILSQGTVSEESLLNAYRGDYSQAMVKDELPSRIAERVFWLGRNAERVEGTLRLLRSVLQSILDDERPLADCLASPGMQALLRSLTASTGAQPGFIGRGGKKRLLNPDRELIALLQDSTRIGTLSNSLTQWQFSAAAVNDRLSAEQLRVFERLDNLHQTLTQLNLPTGFTADKDALNQTLNTIEDLLLVTSGFSGYMHENVTHGDIWPFMMLGKHIERAHQIASVISSMLSSDRDNNRLLEHLLRLFDSVMTYRSRYRSALDIRLVLHLLLLDDTNPRSLAFQFKTIDQLIAQLPERRNVGLNDLLRRLAISGTSRVQLADPQSLLSTERDARQNLQKFLKALQQVCIAIADEVTTRYFTHAETGFELGRAGAPANDILKAVNDINDKQSS